jgi:hypothetical protein
MDTANNLPNLLEARRFLALRGYTLVPWKKSGALWVVTGRPQTDDQAVFDYVLPEFGVPFTYAKQGGKQTHHVAAWYCRLTR